ncbi:MAG: glutamate-5-semialdehyde dehydrogenase [Chloroherpetonaceae bacterium]|nr:glutamate-5-semialdehyde dehydrogenase [Chloroherpetonaceae bacterium]
MADLNNLSSLPQNTLLLLKKAKSSSSSLLRLTTKEAEDALSKIAIELEKYSQRILEANSRDLKKMDPNNPKYDRLLLSPSRLESILKDMRRVSLLPSPIGTVLERKKLENGLTLEKIRVPLGSVGVIYEARPNVTFDVFALCFKSGNVCILKGGSDAEETNRAAVQAIQEILTSLGLNPSIITLLPIERAATDILLSAREYVDVLIPRGSQELIQFVREKSLVAVIETGAGIVHTYFDQSGDLEKGKEIIYNAKTRRPSVCNSLDTLIIHRSRLNDLIPLVRPLLEKRVLIYADELSFKTLDGNYPYLEKATEEHFGIEFLSLTLSVKTVDTFEHALAHIAQFSSKHSEAIISEDAGVIEDFLNLVDAAAVYANASTAFTDGGEFGMGAEIGISTQKLHARGPMALPELCTYKWKIRGDGQVR